MLRHRLSAAVALIAPVLLLFWLDDQHHFQRPGIWFLPFALWASYLASAEVSNLMRSGGLSVNRMSSIGGTLLVVLLSHTPLLWQEYPANCPLGKVGWTLVGFAGVVTLIFVVEMRDFREPGGCTQRISHHILVVTYVGLLLSFLVQLRQMHPNRLGLVALFGTIFVTKLSDAGAYFAGRFLGRHKMSPVLSPKKTIEGALGGALVACLGALLVFHVIVPQVASDEWNQLASAAEKQLPYAIPIWFSCGYGITVALAGIVGDLAESLLKRDLGAKDSGSILPGLGGMLDVADSLLFAAPVSFMWWTLLP